MEGLAKLLVSTLGGAAAGYDAPSAGAAIGSGISTGMALNEAFEAPERRRKQEERQDKLFQMQQERHNMSKENHAVRMENIDYTKQQRGINQNNAHLKALMTASQEGQSREALRYESRINQYNAEAAQTGRLPINRKDVGKALGITKSAVSQANIQSALFLGQQFATAENPIQKKWANDGLKLLSLRTGLNFTENKNGDKVINHNGVFHPLTPEAMAEIQKAENERAEANFNEVVALQQSRDDARSGSKSAILSASRDLPFVDYEKELKPIAQKYSDEIGQNPIMSKVHGLTHIMNMVLKDKESPVLNEKLLSDMEGILTVGGIEYDRSPEEMYINGKDLNDYFNSNVSSHRQVQFFDNDSMQKVDKNLLDKLRQRSGLSDLRQNYLDGLSALNKDNQQQQEYATQKLIADSDFKEDLKTKQEIRSSERKNDVVMNKLRKGSFGKYKFEEIANTLPELSDGTFPVVAQIESMYENYVNEKSSITKLEREWSKAGYSGTYKEAIKDPSSTIFDLAKDHRKEFSKISPKIEEKVKLGLLRDFLTRRDVYDKKLKALSAKPTTQKKDLRSITEKNETNILDITKKAREN